MGHLYLTYLELTKFQNSKWVVEIRFLSFRKKYCEAPTSSLKPQSRPTFPTLNAANLGHFNGIQRCKLFDNLQSIF